MINTFNVKIVEAKIRTRLVEIASNSTYHYLALTAILLFAAGLRFYKLGEWSLWIDELFEINSAQRAINEPVGLARVSLLLTGIALNYLAVNEWSARLVPALMGVVSILILYFPVRKLLGPAIALLSAALLALSPWHLYWSQNARFYTTLILFYALAQFAFFFWLESDRLRYLILSGLLFGLAVMERWVALYFVPVVGMYFLMLIILRFEKPAGFRPRNLLLLVLSALVVGFYILFGSDMLSEFYSLFIGYQHNPIRVLMSVIYDVGLPLFLTALLGGVYLILQKSRLGLYLLMSAVVPVALLVIMAPFTQTFSRYVFITLPSWIILGAFAAVQLFTQVRMQTKLLAVGVLLLLLVDPFSQNVLYYGFQNGNREDFKSAFALVQQQRTPEDTLVSTRPLVGTYYTGEEVISSEEVDLDQIVESGRRAWFVIDNRTFVSSQLQSWLDENTSLEGVYDVYLAGKVMMMRVYLYDPARP